jgi:NTP pyrophosphatase (non-canonical NTP hydrolase)
MKRAVLSSVNPGETFKWGGTEFVLLEQKESGECVCITKDLAQKENIPFDTQDRPDQNNLDGSEMLKWLENWLAGILTWDGVNVGDVLDFDIDLTAVDGTTGYPPVRTKVGLLTLDEYRKYRKLIPLVSDWWPLATPWSQLPDYANSAHLVRTAGTLGGYYVYYALFAPRPALHLKSSIFVSVEGKDEEQTPEQREMALYEGAVEKYGTHAQILMAVEEMSELTKALLKYIRHEDFGQGDEETVLQSIAEERADVSIMLAQLDVIFGDNSEMECAKLDHLEDLLNV